MNTEIYIEGYALDLTADISSLITFAIDDIKDFANRATTFSKTVVLPGTANNNKLFGSIFETGIANEYDPLSDNVGYNFNASKSARVLILQDNLQTFKGTLRLLEINIDRGRKEYEVALNGELTNLSTALSNSLLEDLDFSAYDQNFTVGNIIASWDNTPGTGVYYPLIDYGTYSVAKHDWDIRTFRPALYVKEMIDKMFEDAGYTYESDFLDTDEFKRLVVPYNKKVFQSLTNEEFSASRSNSANYLDQSTIFTRPVQMTTVNGTLFTASLSNSRFTYVGAAPLSAHFTFSAGNRILRPTKNFYIEVWLNGTLVPGTTTQYAPNGNTSPGFYSYSAAFDYTIAPGEYLELIARCDGMAGGDIDFMQLNNAGIGCTSVDSVLAPVGIGDFFQMSQAIPQNIRQVDFLKSIVQLFNLYITESQFDERHMIIEPFINFFDGDSSTVVDWTYKLDRDSVIKIKPMSELNTKIYNFNWKEDSDYYNDLYNKRYNQGYGSMIFDTEFEFADQTTTITSIFAATPLVGYDGEDKVYPTIFKRTGIVTGVGEETVDSEIRILRTKKVLGVSSWNILDGAAVIGTSFSYGYAGHLDDPDAPSIDLNFGALQELFFTLVSGDLSNTQFNVYWSAYMAEITDKDSKLLTAKFYLTPRDIFELSFAHYVFLDGILFRINKISDYNASLPSTCTVELLKVINSTYTFVPFPPVVPRADYWIDSDGTYVTDSDSSKIPFQ